MRSAQRDDRREEERAGFAAMLSAGAMIAHQVAAKAARDAFFLSSFDVRSLPRMVVVSAIVSVGVVLVMSRLMTKRSPARVVPWAFFASAVFLFGEWALMSVSPSATAVLFYLHTIVFGSVLTSGFWSMVNERFDPRTAKRLVGRIAAGGTLGALVGGICAERIGASLSLSLMFPFLAVLHVFSGVVVRDVAAPTPARGPAPPPGADAAVQSGLTVLAARPYLRHIALLVILSTLGASLLDWVLKAEAVAVYTSGEALMRFFAAFYAAIGLMSFLVQTALSRTAMEKLGLGKTVALLPGLTLFGSLGAAFVPGLGAITAARGTEGLVRSSLYRSAYELLYTPVRPDEKRSTKSIIDVLCDRFADAAGGAVVTVVLVLVPTSPQTAILLVVSALSGLGLLVAFALQRGYVRALESSLAHQAPNLPALGPAAGPQVDRVVRFTEHLIFDHRAGGFAPADPEALLSGVGLSLELSPAATLGGARTQRLAAEVEEARRLAQLCSRDRGQVVAALANGPLTAAMIPQAILLLGWNEVVVAALAALGAVADDHLETLVAALRDPEQDFSIRRRLPRALARASSAGAVAGLADALSDPRFEVRFQAGRALAKILGRGGPVPLDPAVLNDAVLREVDVGRGIWESQQVLDTGPDPDSDVAEQVLRDRAGRSMEHVFRLLSLILPKEPIELAFRGIQTEDLALRGTALEYLESVLPERIREKLWPFLEADRARRPTRTAEEALQALLASSTSIAGKLERMRADQGEDEDP